MKRITAQIGGIVGVVNQKRMKPQIKMLLTQMNGTIKIIFKASETSRFVQAFGSRISELLIKLPKSLSTDFEGVLFDLFQEGLISVKTKSVVEVYPNKLL